ncbi:MAG TPA: SRPBCC family protein [Aquella sp.]|nr:SRPBCC family protein [Aquella sp.]
MSDKIEKSIELNQSVSRVWKAITDYQEFGKWFGVKMENQFIPGSASCGQITYPGYEHLRMEIIVQKIEPEELFSLTWHPNAVDPEKDYSEEPLTLVEFRLKKTEAGTLLSLVESGFDKIPANRRSEAFSKNDGGWAEQMTNIKNYLKN